MGWLAFLLIGLLAGAIAKAVMPGTKDEPSGWLMTMVLGIVGAFVGGFVGQALNIGGGFITELFLAAIGAIIVIALLRLITGNRAAV